jgi:hypothetical protein
MTVLTRDGDEVGAALDELLDTAYPDQWDAAWLSLGADPAVTSPYVFHVICSDLPAIRAGHATWPPASRNPNAWLRWEYEPSRGFWVRPRKYDPIVRDRWILVELGDLPGSFRGPTITHAALRDACRFAGAARRVVWHNPPKGGASAPDSAHFQAMPLYRNATPRSFSLPCCNYEAESERWEQATTLRAETIKPGFDAGEYPVTGLTVWGPIQEVADLVWGVIWNYDRAQACNLVIQPADSSGRDIIRVFVFPRALVANHHVRDELLHAESARLLLRNNRGGRTSVWSYAGIEMGLLTQVEWGELFDRMREEPAEWGRILFNLLRALILDASSDDWSLFQRVCDQARAQH